MSKIMSVKTDLKCMFNMPEKIKSEFNSEDEMSHSLPPFEPMDAYPVDEYDACPNSWMNGSDIASSYFVGVKEDYGMWLDFNECFYHTHDVAVVISIQGINPITGQTMVKEKALQLEQYHTKCPIHKMKFEQDRYCDKCGFKWPGQNYLSTTGTPEMKLWLDGFRSSDGKVRQYIITEDKMRSVAAEVMKKRGEDPENRVFAIGIAYYLSKHKKPYMLQRPDSREVGSGSGLSSHYGSPRAFMGSPMFFSPCHTPQSWGGNRVSDLEVDSFAGDVSDLNLGSSVNCSNTNSTSPTRGSSRKKKFGSKGAIGASAAQTPDILDSPNDKTVYQLGPKLTDAEEAQIQAAEDAGESVERYYTLNKEGKVETKIARTGSVKHTSVKPVVPVKKLEIGAGALIKQRVYEDPKMIDYWETEPAGMIYINYCDEETKKKIIDGGRRADAKDGFLKDVKVGG